MSSPGDAPGPDGIEVAGREGSPAGDGAVLPDPPGRRRRRWIRPVVGGVAVVALVAAVGAALGRDPGSAYGPSYRLVAGRAEPGATRATTTTTVAGIVGIDRPITVEGVQLQVHSVTRVDAFEGNVPTDAANDFVVVTAAVHAGSQEALAKERFPVVLTAGPDRKSPSITVTKSASGILNEVDWAFVAARSAASLALELPGGRALALDQLLASGPRPVPTTTPTTRPDPDLLVRESFVEPGAWFVGERDGWSVRAGEGVYRVTASEAAAGWLGVAPLAGAHDRVKVSVGVTKRSSGRALFGVACRTDAEGRSYQALVDSTGYYRIARIDRAGGRSVTLAEPESEDRYLSEVGTTTNVVLECTGAPEPGRPVVLRLFVGGRQLPEVHDDSGLAAGGVGLVVVPRGGPADVAFTGFSASRLRG